MTEPIADPLADFKRRVHDILAFRAKLEAVPPIGGLNGKDSAILTVLGLAAERMLEDAAMDLAQTSMDALAATLLAIHEHGIPEGGGLLNAGMQRVAEILAKAGGHD